MSKLLSAAIALSLLASNPSYAGPKTKVSILFQDFPSGTQCNVSGAVGRVKLAKKRGHPKVDVKGNGEIGTYFCTLSDGRRVKTDVNLRLPQNSKTAGITVYLDGRAFVTVSTTDGQLLSFQFNNTMSDF